MGCCEEAPCFGSRFHTPCLIVATVFRLLMLGVYLLPTIIAQAGRVEYRFVITLMDVLLGWTVVGWLASLFWAFIDQPISRRAET